MFSSNNNNVGSDCFGAYNGLISSSVLHFCSSPSPSLLEEDDRMLVDGFLSLLVQNEHGVGLVDHHHSHHFVDEVHITAGYCDGKNHGSTVVEKVHEDVEPVKRPAKRIRTGKRDRHSKICTAKGPRDRRMRLSLQVARKFFDLQDTLGFDKASHTIEWLFNVSNNAIKEVMGSAKRCNNDTIDCSTTIPPCSESVSKDCSSRFKEKTRSPRTDVIEADRNKLKIKKINRCKKNKSSTKLNIKLSSEFKSAQRKDVRNKARARARERTRDRTSLKVLQDFNHQELGKSSEQAGSCNPFDHVDETLAGAQSCVSVEELMIHADWEHIINLDDSARFYSNCIL